MAGSEAGEDSGEQVEGPPLGSARGDPKLGPGGDPELVEGPHVLIVDDEPPARALLRAAVEALPFPCRISEAGNSEAALEISRSSRPDVVLLDIVLPDSKGSGVMVCKELCQDLRTRVVIVTAQPGGRMIDMCLNAGAVAHIQKPFSVPDLRAKLEGWLAE